MNLYKKILSIVLVLILLLLLCVTNIVPVFAAYQYFTQFGSPGTAGGNFDSPQGMAIDSSGNIYVADYNNQRIEEFTSGGIFIKEWDLLDIVVGYDSLHPLDVAVDPDGNMYITAFGVTSVFFDIFPLIVKIDQNGNNLGGQASGDIFTGVALDSTGNVYVVDADTDTIYEYSSDLNTEIRHWGSSGGGDGQFLNPTGITLDASNNVYVADTGHNRIEKFTSDGTYLTQWGSSGSGNGQFNQPEYLNINSLGHIFVADSGNHRVQEFDSSGNYISQIGTVGSGDGQFQSPYGVAFDNSSNLFVTDAVLDRVQKFNYIAPTPTPTDTPTPTPTPTSTPTPTPLPQPICSPSHSSVMLENGVAQATITASNGSGMYSWLSGGSDAIDTSGVNESVATITYSSVGSYYVFATANGIQSVGCVVDVVNPSPTSTPNSNAQSSGNSSSSLPICLGVTQAPDLFQINTTKNSSTLYYSPILNASNYAIYYGYDDASNQFAIKTNQGSSTGVLSYTVNSLPSNSTIYFKVFAQNNCGQGAWSNTIQIKTNGRSYYKNIISQAFNVPSLNAVLGEKTVSKPKLIIKKIINASPIVSKTPTSKAKSKVLGATTKKSCFLFFCR